MKRWIRSSTFALALTGALLVPLAEAHAALNAYLNLKGQKQGDIKGPATGKGREGAIQIESIAHEITSPRDASTGMATGKRQHKPFVITKPVDRTSPMIAAALTSNEVLSKWELSVYMPSMKSGAETLAYKIKLIDASVISIKLSTDSAGGLHEEISFAYRKIDWTWTDGGVTHEDEWPTK